VGAGVSARVVPDRRRSFTRAFQEEEIAVLFGMSFAELLKELPTLSPEQRLEVVHRVMELDDVPLSEEEEVLVAKRLAEHHANPSSSLPVDEVIARLERQFPR
jgi:uncharacterized protein Smg (DUF494 family)